MWPGHCLLFSADWRQGGGADQKELEALLGVQDFPDSVSLGKKIIIKKPDMLDEIILLPK